MADAAACWRSFADPATPSWRARSTSPATRGRRSPRPTRPPTRARRRVGGRDRRLHRRPDAAWAFLRALAQADRDPACSCSSAAASSPTSTLATTCSTTSACRRSTRRARGPAAPPAWTADVEVAAPTSSSTATSSLNLETYQASIAGRPLDLTYMEYELLKFLAQNPGKVFTREILLSRVWGYEYYGGARTVDVHVRRLRAKLGEEHAGLIQTVRSVGYRFGQIRWELAAQAPTSARGLAAEERRRGRRRRPRRRPRFPPSTGCTPSARSTPSPPANTLHGATTALPRRPPGR